VEIPGLLVCGYNRPDNLAKMLKSPALEIFSSILISLDVVQDSRKSAVLAETYRDVISSSKYSSKISISSSQNHEGLYYGMRRAIDLAFEKFETCVILEEDCIPSSHLPSYIQEMCTIHHDLILQSHICLSRHVKRNQFSGMLSNTKYPFVWGWFTSREVWAKSRVEAHELNRADVLTALRKVPGSHENFQDHWLKMFDACSLIATARNSGRLDSLDQTDRFISWALNSWATPYTLAYWTKNDARPAIRPHSNFIHNIGFDKRASHTFRRPRHARRIDLFGIETSSALPISIEEYDQWEDQEIFGIEKSSTSKENR
jgi:hypothetical protein